MYKVIIYAALSTVDADLSRYPLSRLFVGMGRSPKKAFAAAQREMDQVYAKNVVMSLIVKTLADANGHKMSQEAFCRGSMRLTWLQDWQAGRLGHIESLIAEHVGAPVHYTRMVRGSGNHA
jgi:hypothetical protein